MMEHLFSHPYLAIFLPLENNCYTQLSGRPVYTIEPICKVEERLLKRKRRVDREMAKETARQTRKKRKTKARAGNVCESSDAQASVGHVAQQERVRKNIEIAVEEKEKQFLRPPVMVEIVRNRMFYGKWGWRGNKRLPAVGLPANRE